MGNAQSTVRYLAPASFLYDFAAQQYGMFSKPNMLDIHNKNLAAFSPYPYAIAGFFFPQQLFQLAWLWKLWKQDGTSADCSMMNKFAWVYSLGNFCIGSTLHYLLPALRKRDMTESCANAPSVDVLLELE